MQRLMIFLTVLVGLSASAGAVDIGCQFNASDNGPCNDLNAYDAQPVPAVVAVADRHPGIRSATCDYNLALGSGVPIFGKCPKETGEAPAPVVNVDQEAEDHARATYERVRDAGGCNADFIPHEIAAYCWNRATNGYPPEGSIGSHGGSE